MSFEERVRRKKRRRVEWERRKDARQETEIVEDI